VRKVKKHTGIPISIGIGPTKTLAKIANKIAKKNPAYGGYYDITNHPEIDALLESVPVGDVWGIGRRYNRFLLGKGITTARALRDCPDSWVRKNLTISGLRTVHELRGIPCFEFGESNDAKKSITVSRSFGKPITQCGMLKQAVARYTITAAQKLREEECITGTITVFVIVSQPQDSQRRYESACIELPSATFYTADFITAAKLAVDRIFKPGLIYRKAGIILTDLIPQEFMQLQWHTAHVDREKQKSVIDVVDHANAKWGKDTLTFAAAGTQAPWKTKAEKKSGNFTTSWQELLTIKE
jgi:DNA polymerase V